MKNKTLLSVLAFVAVVTTASKCGGEKKEVRILRTVTYKNSNTEKSLLAAGDIAVENLMIDSSIARQAIQESATKIKLGGSFINPYAGRLASSALTLLQTEVSTMVCTGGCSNSLAAVCISYGQKGTSLVPYLQPMLLCTSGSTFITRGVKKQNYTLCVAGSTYSVTNQGTLSVISGQALIREMNKSISLYQTPRTSNPYGVEVMDPAGNFQDFVLSNSAIGSARTIIYPITELQQIVGTMDTVKLWNAIEGVEVYDQNGDVSIINKHDLIISSKDVTIKNTKLQIEQNAKFANLSNICPPSCKEGSVTIVVQ